MHRFGLRGMALGVCAMLSPLGAAQAEPADLLLHNGQVLTVDKTFSKATAIAVRDGRVLAVGGQDLVARYKAATTIDLNGRTLMPGFTDTHVHLVALGRRQIDVARARSIPEIQDMLRRKAAELGPGEWITGYGWDEAQLAEKRNPSRADLDAGAPDNPVVLTRAGFHSSVSNSRAFQIAGITKATIDPPRGVIERDGQGEASGVIRESSELVTRFVPKDTFADMRSGYVTAIRDLASLGVTSFIGAGASIADELGKDAGVGGPFNPTVLQLQSIYREFGAGLPRMTVNIAYPGLEALKTYPRRTGDGDDRLRIGAIGETPGVDGGFTGPTAWTLADYKNQPGFRGRRSIPQAELDALLVTAAAERWQVGLHAIGDAAIVAAVDSYRKALAATPDPKARRWYLGHFTVMPPEATMKQMAESGIAITQQPNFSYTLEGRYAANLDDWRLAHNNAIATPLKHGVHIAFGGDNLPIDPRVGLYAAITRKGMSGAVHGPEEAVSRPEAIGLYTATAAYLTFEEDKKGTLEPGKLADMIVLDRDPLTVPEAELLTMNVDMTIVGGRIVYRRANTP